MLKLIGVLAAAVLTLVSGNLAIQHSNSRPVLPYVTPPTSDLTPAALVDLFMRTCVEAPMGVDVLRAEADALRMERSERESRHGARTFRANLPHESGWDIIKIRASRQKMGYSNSSDRSKRGKVDQYYKCSVAAQLAGEDEDSHRSISERLNTGVTHHFPKGKLKAKGARQTWSFDIAQLQGNVWIPADTEMQNGVKTARVRYSDPREGRSTTSAPVCGKDIERCEVKSDYRLEFRVVLTVNP